MEAFSELHGEGQRSESGDNASSRVYQRHPKKSMFIFGDFGDSSMFS